MKLCQVVLRCSLWVAAFAAFVYVGSYLSDAHTRATKAPACEWNAVPSPNNAPYLARFCYLDKETVLLRLYDAEGKALLAERSLFELDRPRFHWESDALGYNDRKYDGGEIALPPTLLERLRAKLP
jgi:hypothetical protein